MANRPDPTQGLSDVTFSTSLTAHAGIQVPLICGAMYPCSNPELVAAVSEAGGIGIVQPISLTYVHGHDFREGLRLIRRLTSKPIGMNALIEQSSRAYHERMSRWIDIALEEGVRFFVTSLGNPRWVVERVTPVGGVVYHDVTERKWADKGLAGGVKGLIAVNRRAGGHAGPRSAEELIEELGAVGGSSDLCRGNRGSGGVRRSVENGIRRCPARHPVHRHAGVSCEHRVQGGDSPSDGSGYRPERANHRSPGRCASVRRSSNGWDSRQDRSPAGCCAVAGPSTGCGPSTRSSPSGSSRRRRWTSRESGTTGRLVRVREDHRD